MSKQIEETIEDIVKEELEILNLTVDNKLDKINFIKDNIRFLTDTKNVGVVSEKGYERLMLNEEYSLQIEDNIMILVKELMKEIKKKINE